MRGYSIFFTVVIILVRLATSLRSFSRRPNRTYFVLRSKTTQDRAETGGAGLSIKILVNLISLRGKLDRSEGWLSFYSFQEPFLFKVGCADFYPALRLNPEDCRELKTFSTISFFSSCCYSLMLLVMLP